MSQCHTERQPKAQHAMPVHQAETEDNRQEMVSLFILRDSWWSDTVHVPCCIEKSIQLFGCLCCCPLLQLAQNLGQMRLQSALHTNVFVSVCVHFWVCACDWIGCKFMFLYESLNHFDFCLIAFIHLFVHSKYITLWIYLLYMWQSWLKTKWKCLLTRHLLMYVQPKWIQVIPPSFSNRIIHPNCIHNQKFYLPELLINHPTVL